MLTITDPELSADELVARVRDEARRRQQLGPATPARTASPLPPPVSSPAHWAGIQYAIGETEQHAVIGTTVPPMHTLTGWRRRLAVPVAKAVLRLAALITREQTSFNVETIKTLRLFAETVAFQQRALEQRQTIGEDQLRGRLEAVSGDAERDRTAAADRLGGLDRALETLQAAVQTQADRFQGFQGSARHTESALDQARADLARLRTQLALQERRVAVLLEDARRGDQPSAATATTELAHLLDAFYVSFEDAFRGPRDTVKERVRVHLAPVREAGAGTTERPVLDIACGRGEWLEVLQGEGLVCRGVDTNRVLVAENRARGLDVVESDAYAYLRTLPDQSVGAVSVIHFLEHLPFADMVALLDEILRVLRPGGVVVCETPNPQNLLVGASYFYIDPTHRNPIYPDSLVFLAEARGFVRVRALELHPADEAARLPEDGSAVTERLNRYLYGPQDFAVIGYRA